MQNKNKLEGDALDAEVARIEGMNAALFHPSSDWAHGGPIIEREKIVLLYYGAEGEDGGPWEAQMGGDTHYVDQYAGDATSGPTALVAAMRAYVESKQA